MKKVIYFFIAASIFAACSQNEQVRYASSSPEIDIYKEVQKYYYEANWDGYMAYYADTAKLTYNMTKGSEINIDAAIEQFKRDHELFSSITFRPEDDFYEMVVTDTGETWVNYWGVWVGTLPATGKQYELPLHLTARFIDGKIVMEHGYWNNADIVLDLHMLEHNNE